MGDGSAHSMWWATSIVNAGCRDRPEFACCQSDTDIGANFRMVWQSRRRFVWIMALNSLLWYWLIGPSRLMKDGFIGRFNRSYREEVLGMYVFRTLGDAHKRTELG